MNPVTMPDASSTVAGAEDARGAAGGSHAVPARAGGHMVQFYQDDQFLAGVVAEFLATGLAAAQPLLVVATRAHRDAFAAELVVLGCNVSHAEKSGQLTWLDAHVTLDAIMDGAFPDAGRFRSVIGAAMAQVRQGRDEAVVRVFGEMVGILWDDGNTDGAVRLEALWNDLADEHPFSLLCAYAMDGFDDAAHAEAFGAICNHHTHVFPTEQYSRANDDARLREVSFLEQRARSLDAEVARRVQLERRLRETEHELQDHLAHTANAVSRAKDEFLAVMSHELRTPLNAIGGYADLLELGVHGPVTESQREVLSRIRTSQMHLLGLVNEILNYSRIEAGAVAFELSDVRICDVVAAAALLMRSQLVAKGLVFVVESCACASDSAVRIDVEKVQQILRNLFSNAAKFTPPGGTVTLACDDIGGSGADDAWVRVHVSDTGVGISPAKLESVFDPFVQVNAGFTRDHDGAGLGLSISRDLARAMGGDLVAKSAVGVGSTFTLVLPRTT